MLTCFSASSVIHDRASGRYRFKCSTRIWMPITRHGSSLASTGVLTYTCLKRSCTHKLLWALMLSLAMMVSTSSARIQTNDVGDYLRKLASFLFEIIQEDESRVVRLCCCAVCGILNPHLYVQHACCFWCLHIFQLALRQMIKRQVWMDVNIARAS